MKRPVGDGMSSPHNALQRLHLWPEKLVEGHSSQGLVSDAF